jgi:hypothetical protein
MDMDRAGILAGVLEHQARDRRVGVEIDAHTLHEPALLRDRLGDEVALVAGLVWQPFGVTGISATSIRSKVPSRRRANEPANTRWPARPCRSVLRLPQREFAREPLVEPARHVRVHHERHVADMAQDDPLRAVRRDDLLDLAHHHHHLVARAVDPLERRAAAGADVLLVLEPEALGYEQHMGQGFLLGPALAAASSSARRTTNQLRLPAILGCQCVSSARSHRTWSSPRIDSFWPDDFTVGLSLVSAAGASRARRATAGSRA